MSGSPSARARTKSSDISRSARSTTIFDRFAERLEKLGVKRLDPPPGVETNGLWFHDHDGNLVEIKVAAKSSPDRSLSFRKSLSARASVARRSGATSRASRPGVWRMFFCSPATSRKRFNSIRARWAYASPTDPATASPSCTASTAATIVRAPSSHRPRRACII